MVNNIRIFDYNLCTGTAAAITVNSAAVSLPGTNIFNPNRKKQWQTNTGTKIGTSVIDLGTAYDVTGFGLISSNIGTSGTVTIQANTSDSWGAPAYNSGALAVYESSFTSILLWYFSAKTYRYWRMILDDPSNSDNFISVGVAWLGTYVSGERNFQHGWSIETVDLSGVAYADDGTPYTDELGSYKNLNLNISFMTESWALGTLAPLLRRVGKKKDILISLYPERTSGTNIEQKLVLYGRFDKSGPLTNANRLQHFSVNLGFRENG